MSAPLGALMLHAPVASRNVICSGANYFKHVVDIVVAQQRPETEGMTPEQRRAFGIAKMTDRRLHGTPFFFIKANSTMIGPFDDVQPAARCHHHGLGAGTGRRDRQARAFRHA